MKIINHRLHKDDGTPYPFRTVPGTGPVIKPRWLVMHYTADGGSAALNWFASPDNTKKVSAHIVIARDGTITQCVPFNRKANHAGESEWKSVKFLNGHSIGIEMVGYGIAEGGPGKWRAGGKSVPDDEVLVATHKFGKPKGGWTRYPQAQLDAAQELAKLLVREYGLEDVIGHDDISPGRKQDPGPAFPMTTFRAACMQKNAGPIGDPIPAPPGLKPIDRFRVKTTLNVRGGPGATNPTVAGSPLQPGTVVRGAQEQDGWRRITVEGGIAAGWVKAEFVDAIPAELYTVTASSLNVRSGPGATNATVPGSPLAKDTVVQELEDSGEWKRVVSLGASQVTGWVKAEFLSLTVIQVDGLGKPAPV
ncbi:N-acetylmuramoyl-L-alanine amidase [Longimicrobium sp.]|uniref:N-acetylmuramoyl-L-alanine amidase n=1 Tax=Longimicrobium sp. TaxID=2029185 RepID=UPI003B3B624D